MSVLLSKRTTSKTEYLKVANEIYVNTINFLSRLSARYSRLVANGVMKDATDILVYTERANATFPSSDEAKSLRKEYLLRAKAAVMSLDVQLTQCYLLMNQNPQGCFSKNLSEKDCVKKLDNMSNTLGLLIDREKNLIKAVMESDKKRK